MPKISRISLEQIVGALSDAARGIRQKQDWQRYFRGFLRVCATKETGVDGARAGIVAYSVMGGHQSI